MEKEYVSLYRQILAERQVRYNVAISSGQFTPYIYPWDSLPALYMFLAMIIFPRLPRRTVRILRYPVFLLIFVHCIAVARSRRSLGFAGGYGIGLICAWGVIMSAVFLLFNDMSKNYQRLEIRQLDEKHKQMDRANGHATSNDISRREAGTDSVKRKSAKANQLDHSSLDAREPSEEISAQYRLVWQQRPSDILHAIDWTLDLMTAFRGVNWNYRIPTLAPIDLPIPETTHPSNGASKSSDVSRPVEVPKTGLRKLQVSAIKSFVFYYLLIDLLKTTMTTDPYFLGLEPLTSPTPWHWLSYLGENYSHHIVRLIRLLMSLTGVISALSLIFSLCPLFFSLILPGIIEPSRITRCPVLEWSMYPPYWQSVQTSVLEKGLAGLWGKSWHQLFRYGISDPSRYLITELGLQPKSMMARILQIMIAFFLSGCIHTSAAYTTFSLHSSHPLSGPLTFFLSQGLGILLQSALVKLLQQRGTYRISPPAYIGKTCNAFFVLGYLYLTGPLLANDFARAGIWLFEPLPVSILRGFGFGPGGKDEGWWCWSQEGSRWVGWWPPTNDIGNRQWSVFQKGIAVY